MYQTIEFAFIDEKRLTQVQLRLRELRTRGFRFIQAHEDGEFWFGSRDHGLEITEAIERGFIGEVSLNN